MISKKIFTSVLVVVLGLLVGLGFFFITTKIRPSSGLNIDSFPKSKVYLNGKEQRIAPFYQENLGDGDYTIKLVSTIDPTDVFEVKVKLVPGVVTLVQHIFNKNPALTSTKIVYLEKTAVSQSSSASLVSDPDGLLVKIDGETKGITPLLLKNMKAGGMDITFSKPGFADLSLKGNLVNGYELNAFVKLPQINDQNIVASGSATVSPTPTPAVIDSATIATKSAKPQVEILQTPTGYLRVRSDPSVNSSESGKVYPGEKYDLLDESSGWYKIQLKNFAGWVSSQYSKKSN